MITLPKGVKVLDLRQQQLYATKQNDPASQVCLAVVQVETGGIVGMAVALTIMDCLNDSQLISDAGVLTYVSSFCIPMLTCLMLNASDR